MAVETDPERRAWILRVLGVALSGDAQPTGDPLHDHVASLRERLAEAGRSFHLLKAEGAPEIPALHVAMTEAITKVAAPGAAQRVDALEAAIARALSAARVRDAGAANPRTVQFTTLLLDWRDAQSRVQQNLAALGQAVMSLDGARADPRFPAVERAAASLSSLVPRFGGELEAVVNDAINAGGMKGLAGRAMSALGGYRQALAGAVALGRLESFSKRHVRMEVKLASELDAVLGKLEQAVAAEM